MSTKKKKGDLASLKKLLGKVEAAPNGSPDLDAEFARVFPSAPDNVTRSIDAAVSLIETELPGWWWTCGYCKLSNDASLYVPGSNSYPYVSSSRMGPDFRSGSEAQRLLQHPNWGERFDHGFHRDLQGGTVPLAILTVFLGAKITLIRAQNGTKPTKRDDFASSVLGK